MTGWGQVAALAATTVLVALSVLQILVAAGYGLGRFVWGGSHDVLPTRLRVASAVSVLLYAGFALVLLTRSGALALTSEQVSAVAAWVLCGYFALGIVMNALSRSAAERATMVPACTLLAACSLVVALS